MALPTLPQRSPRVILFMASDIEVFTKYIANEPHLPPLVLQITRLVNSYIVWIGATEVTAEDAVQAPLLGHFAKDCACAMPALDSDVPYATPLFRSDDSDVALSMAQRLARRFGKQVFLSVDVPSSIQLSGERAAVSMQMERSIVATLKELEAT